MTQRLLVLYPPPADPAAFRAYYEGTHLPLARRLPGVRAISYGFEVLDADGRTTYFCAFQADFDSAEALDAALASPEGRAVQDDVPNYATGGAIVLRYEVQ